LVTVSQPLAGTYVLHVRGTQPVTQMSTRSIFWLLKAASSDEWQPWHFYVLTVYNIWEPQPPSALRDCLGLYRNYFTVPIVWSKFVLEQLTVCHLVHKNPKFYGNWLFITAFTAAHYESLFCKTWINSTPPPPPQPVSIMFVLTLFFSVCLSLPNCPLLSG